ncbi:hypothetical protein OHC33_000129 [Knufia fluminis]|uniref:Bicarbonate transporter-like transmembrane domain-containing protein n=1 Tax=Knufia fluminis TaxID=191047 RepID=A0AAN8ETA4_9EURO|nr:hypothetical protein OHC33_000129 [Knufia fluminis]
MLTKVPTLDTQADPYKWQDEQGFWARCAHPCRGMWYDIKRRLPYYWSDIIDGWAYRVFAGTIRIFFINLLPALAFQLDMSHNTGGFFGINEALLSSALAAIVFSTLSAQPLTVVGVTGLISLFNYTIYDIIKLHDVTIYPRFMVWVGIWAAIWHWAIAITNLCDYMRTITDFSSQTFGLYVGTIYVVKGCEELAINFYDGQIANGFASSMIAILYFMTVYYLERIGSTSFATSGVRKFISDYAYVLATVWWTGFSHFPGNLAYADFIRLPITRAFYPTVDRPWVVAFWTLEVKWIFVALPIGFLMMLLFYYDHNVSSLTAQARNFPLKKPAGFHWDFFLLGCTCFAGGILNIPLPNGLVPQAPVHTDSLTYYDDTPEYISTKDHDTEPVIVRHNTKATKVAEQRISHFLMGLALVGMMTRPLLIVLRTMPRAIFSGVFFTVGLGGILTNPILVHKLKFLFTQRQFIPPHEPLLKVKRSQIWHYLGWQLLGWATTVAISQTIAAIGFPVLIMALIPLRWKVLPRLFTGEELEIMDHLTADGEVVLVSLGGKPELPEDRLLRNKESRGREDPERGAAGMAAGMVQVSERDAEFNNEGKGALRRKNKKGGRDEDHDGTYDSERTQVNSESSTPEGVDARR